MLALPGSVWRACLTPMGGDARSDTKVIGLRIKIKSVENHSFGMKRVECQLSLSLQLVGAENNLKTKCPPKVDPD